MAELVPPSPNPGEIRVLADPAIRFQAQIPTVRMHFTAMTALGLPDFTLVAVRHAATGRSVAAWLVGDERDVWDSSHRPWASTVHLSDDCRRALRADGPGLPPDDLLLRFPHQRIPVRPAVIGNLLAGDEIGLHPDDARRLGVRGWAFVNNDGIPAALRVRLSSDDRDRGFARLSFQTRLLLDLPRAPAGLYPEVLVGPLPRTRDGRPLLVPEPHWHQRGTGHGASRWNLLRPAALLEAALVPALRSPSITFRTLEATPGEDTIGTVRLPEEVFPLLGTEPGKEVYLSWGPGNRAVATALAADPDHQEPSYTPPSIVGHRLDHLTRPPDFARIQIGAASRAALGIPRATVVTVRRRVLPLLMVHLNELIVPVTALFVALAADLRFSPWQLLFACIIILGLLVAPLRVRRPPKGRLPL
ncbi:hypothetical protein [Marinactinospora rubrisoli]|uniref:Uncharacterized protein n=1 Tax=Marinactinospora rubrisoli TaxID=2715399 RepID=A0ABW2KJ49_9ACTN